MTTIYTWSFRKKGGRFGQKIRERQNFTSRKDVIENIEYFIENYEVDNITEFIICRHENATYFGDIKIGGFSFWSKSEEEITMADFKKKYMA